MSLIPCISFTPSCMYLIVTNYSFLLTMPTSLISDFTFTLLEVDANRFTVYVLHIPVARLTLMHITSEKAGSWAETTRVVE